MVIPQQILAIIYILQIVMVLLPCTTLCSSSSSMDLAYRSYTEYINVRHLVGAEIPEGAGGSANEYSQQI